MDSRFLLHLIYTFLAFVTSFPATELSVSLFGMLKFEREVSRKKITGCAKITVCNFLEIIQVVVQIDKFC